MFSVAAIDHRYAVRWQDSTWTMGYPDASMMSWDSQWNEIYMIKANNWTQDFQYMPNENNSVYNFIKSNR